MVKKIKDKDYDNLTKEEWAEIKKDLDRHGLDEKLIEYWDTYKSPFGIALNPKDSSDRLLHYNLERLRKGRDVFPSNEPFQYSKENKIDKDSKYIMPFSNRIILGTDTAATLGMGFPIPRIFEEYIMNADKIIPTGEDCDAAKIASEMTINSKRVYVHDVNIDHMILDRWIIRKGVNEQADILLEGYKPGDWHSHEVHSMTLKQTAKALILNTPILTTQFYNKVYQGCNSYFEHMTLPHYHDVMEYMWDTPKHNSKQHHEQIERVLLKLESKNNVFSKISREQYFPLDVEEHIPMEEYNKRDLDYILRN